MEGSEIWFRGLVASPDGSVVLDHEERAGCADAVALGRKAGESLLARGGKALAFGA